MRFRFFLASAGVSFFTSGFFFLGLSNCFKSIVCPVILGPSNFLYWVTIASAFSAVISIGFSIA